MISQLLLLLKNISSRVPFDGLWQDYTVSHIIVSLHHLASKNLHRLVELPKFGVVSNHDVHVWCNPSFLCKEVFWLIYSWMCSWNKDFTELTWAPMYFHCRGSMWHNFKGHLDTASLFRLNLALMLKIFFHFFIQFFSGSSFYIFLSLNDSASQFGQINTDFIPNRFNISEYK